MSNEVQQWVREHMSVNENAPTDEPEFSDHGYSVNVLLDLVEPGWRELVAVPEPSITVTIEHNDLKQGWFWRCSVHGKGPLHHDGEDGSVEQERDAHDACVRAATSHNQSYHGGNGIVPLHMLT